MSDPPAPAGARPANAPSSGPGRCGAGGGRRLFALVPCAGTGTRAGAGGPKQYAAVAGVPVVERTLRVLERVAAIDAIAVVLAPGDEAFERVTGRRDGGPGGRLRIERCGGASRAASVAAGLAALRARGARDDDRVLVHDAARCLVTPQAIGRLIDACFDDPVGGLLALPVADTVKRADPHEARSAGGVDRRGLWLAQTPQLFALGPLADALDAALRTDPDAVTDEASAIEAAGLAPRLVEGERSNVKITFPGDFEFAERLLAMRAESTMEPTTHDDTPALRIGEGWDVHRLVEGRPLVLGGVTIAHTHGLLGHSDADALLHAITDAMLGAAALGDIGRHFPDTDERFRGADSGALLAEARRRVEAAGFSVVNVDATVVAQAPKLAPHMPSIVARVAALLGVPAGRVNVKAKTAEGLGPVGERAAIEARATCLLRAGAVRTGR